jgi:hypothetical protein
MRSDWVLALRARISLRKRASGMRTVSALLRAIEYLMYDVTDIMSYLSLSREQNNPEWDVKNVARKFRFGIGAKLLPMRRLLAATPGRGMFLS